MAVVVGGVGEIDEPEEAARGVKGYAQLVGQHFEGKDVDEWPRAPVGRQNPRSVFSILAEAVEAGSFACGYRLEGVVQRQINERNVDGRVGENFGENRPPVSPRPEQSRKCDVIDIVLADPEIRSRK